MNESFATGPSSPPLLEKTIGDALLEVARRHGSSTALIVPKQKVRWTWAELLREVDALATGLLKLGLQPGDRLGIWAPNQFEWALTQFATARIGVILVNINPAYRPSELEYALAKVGCRAVICASRFKSSDYLGMIRDLDKVGFPGLEYVISLGADSHEGFIPFNTLRGDVDPSWITATAAGLDCNDPINIQFTSGTTGAPKGATLTHRNILNNGYFVGETLGLGPQDKVCIPVPLYHCFGMVMGNLACVNHGAAMVYPSRAFDPLSVLQTVEQQRCTALYGVPTMFIQILNHPEFDRYDLSSLRTGIMAGSPCPEAIMREVIGRMHMSEITIAYGMTETSPVSFQTDRNVSLEERVTTVGRVQPHLEVKLIHPNGEVVLRGEPGELCTRGYSVMRGYWNDAEGTASALDAEGWMHTGDIGILDETGCCRITGRIKDMVIRGGENIYPREIEEFLACHPAIADVQVVGVPDARLGEELCAFVILKAGHRQSVDTIRNYCKGKISHYKVPRYVLLVKEFPLTVSGKVQKFMLRERAIAMLNSSGSE